MNALSCSNTGCIKVTISVKRRWDAQDRGKTDFRLKNICYCILSYIPVQYSYIWRHRIKWKKLQER